MDDVQEVAAVTSPWQSARQKQGKKSLFWLMTSESFQSVIAEGVREREFYISVVLWVWENSVDTELNLPPWSPARHRHLQDSLFLSGTSIMATPVVLGVWGCSTVTDRRGSRRGSARLETGVSIAFKGSLPVTCFCQHHLLKAPTLQNSSTRQEPSVQNTSLWG